MNEFADHHERVCGLATVQSTVSCIITQNYEKKKFVLIHTQSLGQIFIEMRVHY